jgi:hypothetical protein
MKELFSALAKFQQEIPVIHKDSQAHKYTYADLPKILEVINPYLKKHDLGFTQLLCDGGLKTIIFHTKSGEMIESFTPIPLVSMNGMNDYQAYGSGITYFRRYALSSALGLVTDKDTDASGVQTAVKPISAPPKDFF